MLRFVDTDQQSQAVQAARARLGNFQEIYATFDPATAAEQASRCSQCGVPFCQVHCPLQNNIPDWLMLAAEGRLQEAYSLSSATNTFPEICGRICPQDRLCEGNCVIEKGFHAVTIGAVEKYITETAFTEGWVQPIRAARETGLSVGIIGAGPAGLSAAEQLRMQGHSVDIYDRYDRAGGLMIYGIPHFKLDKHVVARRIALFEQGGIRFHYNVDIGRNIGFEEVRARHDAVLIATGVYKARALDVPESSLAGIVPALDYLTASNRVCLGDRVAAYDSGALNAEKKHVVVIGGGDTAMDCVRTAVRQHAASVTCLYRRDRANMPGSLREVKNAEEEGVVFEWLAAPRACVGRDHVDSVLVQRMRLAPAERGGRANVIPIPGDTYARRADMVIAALGYDAEDIPTLWHVPELALSKQGTIAAHKHTFQTSLPGVFAAGDIVRGASLVVWAIRDGRDAAAAMGQYLAQKQVRAA